MNTADASQINLGIAMRMATLMRLHREETYTLAPGSSPDIIMKAEVARRTIVSPTIL